MALFPLIVLTILLAPPAHAQEVLGELILSNKNNAERSREAFGKPQGPQSYAPWLIQVKSVYTRDKENPNDPEKKAPIQGAGTLLEYKGRYFVACDAHLSQGEGLSLKRLDGQPLKILGRRSDNDEDIEAIEVENPGTQAIPYNRQSAGFIATVSFNDKGSIDEFRYIHSSYRGITPLVPWLKNEPKGWIARQEASYASSWSNSFEDLFLVQRMQGTTVKNYDGNEFITDSKATAGLSGGPLLEQMPVSIYDLEQKRFHYLFSGLTKAYDRNFVRTYYSTSEEVLKVINDYIANPSVQQASATRWRFGQFTYRDFGDGTLEINPLAMPAGSGESADGGSGESADGGSGESADGGSGESADGGSGESADGGATNLHHRLRLKAGMKVKGKDAIAFIVKRPNGKKDYLYANAPAFLHLRKEKLDKEIEIVAPGGDLTELLSDRLRSPESEESSFPGACGIEKEYFDKRKNIRLLLPVSENAKQYALDFDAQGRIVGREKEGFIPVHKVQLPNGKTIILDIRGLFFTDIASLRSASGHRKSDVFFRKAYIIVQDGEQKLDTALTCSFQTKRHWLENNIKVLNPVEPKVDTATLNDCIEKLGSTLDKETLEFLQEIRSAL